MSSTAADMQASSDQKQTLVEKLEILNAEAQLSSRTASVQASTAGTQETNGSKETKTLMDIEWISPFPAQAPTEIMYGDKPPKLGGKASKVALQEILDKTKVQKWAGTLWFESKESLEVYRTICASIAKREPSSLKNSMTSEELLKQNAKTLQKLQLANMGSDLGCGIFALDTIEIGEKLIYGGRAYATKATTPDEGPRHLVNSAYLTGVTAEKSKVKGQAGTDARDIRDFAGWMPHLPSAEEAKMLKEEYTFTKKVDVATENFEQHSIWLSDLEIFVSVLEATARCLPGEVVGHDYRWDIEDWERFTGSDRCLIEKTGKLIPRECYYPDKIAIVVDLPKVLKVKPLAQVIPTKILQESVSKKVPFCLIAPEGSMLLCMEPYTLKTILKKNRPSVEVKPDAILTPEIANKALKIVTQRLLKLGFKLAGKSDAWQLKWKENVLISPFHLTQAEAKVLSENWDKSIGIGLALKDPRNPNDISILMNLQACYNLAKRHNLIEVQKDRYSAKKLEQKEGKEAKELKDTADTAAGDKPAAVLRMGVTDTSATGTGAATAMLPQLRQQQAMINHQYVRFLHASQDTTALAYLKKVFQLPFVGAVKENDCLDAILPIENIEILVKVKNQIQECFELELPLRLQYAEDGEMQLVIPHINAENARAINAFTIRPL